MIWLRETVIFRNKKTPYMRELLSKALSADYRFSIDTKSLNG